MLGGGVELSRAMRRRDREKAETRSEIAERCGGVDPFQIHPVRTWPKYFEFFSVRSCTLFYLNCPQKQVEKEHS